MNLSDARHILRVSEKTILELCSHGIFYAVKRNGKWDIPSLPFSGDCSTPHELSITAGISHRRIIKLCEKGKIQAYKIGKQWRIPETAVTEYMRERREIK